MNPQSTKKVNEKIMSESEYYYGCTFDTWDLLTYPEAIKDRYKRVKKVYETLFTDELKNGRNWTFDQKLRMFNVEKALKDNKQLLDERNNLK